MTKIPRRIASNLLQSLSAGVVPRQGLEYINAGRKEEIAALLSDLETVANGGAACRFVVGRYGAGKSFLLGLMRNLALEKGFVVCDCDLSPERRLVGAKGQGLATYRELLHNLSVRTKPDGGALSLLMEKWLTNLMLSAAETESDPEKCRETVKKAAMKAVASAENMVAYYDFARVLTVYFEGYLDGDEEKKSAALRWIRGEYETKTEARKALGVGNIITDENWYDHLKLFSAFSVKIGYRGMILLLDELVNLYKIVQTASRQSNYEKLLTLFNDTLQGKASHIGIYFCVTPQMMDDTRRGIASYEALRSRLSEGRFASGRRDLFGPVLRLETLTNEELLLLAENLQELHSQFYGGEKKMSRSDLVSFLQLELDRIGADTLLTPREITRDLLSLLNLLEQSGESDWKAAVSENFAFATSGDNEEIPDGFSDFVL